VTYYEVLGVPQDASPSQIRDAHRKQILQWHPDHNNGSKQAEERFKLIQEAHRVLVDPIQRANYDATLRGTNGNRAEERQRKAEEERQRARAEEESQRTGARAKTEKHPSEERPDNWYAAMHRQDMERKRQEEKRKQHRATYGRGRRKDEQEHQQTAYKQAEDEETKPQETPYERRRRAAWKLHIEGYDWDSIFKFLYPLPEGHGRDFAKKLEANLKEYSKIVRELEGIDRKAAKVRNRGRMWRDVLFAFVRGLSGLRWFR